MSDTQDEPRTLSIDELQDWIGREHPLAGIDEVTRSDIRRKLEVYCFDCPLHYDDAVAQAHGYRGIVAPVALIPLWAMPAYWSPGEPVLYRPGVREQSGGIRTDVPVAFQGGVNTASRWEYFEPLYLGDTLHGHWSLTEAKPHESRLGAGVFLTVEATLFKQSGELVAKNSNTHFRFTPKPRDGERKKRDETTAEAVEQPPVTTEAVDWNRGLRLSDVAIGDAVPPYAIWLSYQRIVMSVAADRMFSGLHHNQERARWRGFRDIIFNTRGYEMMFEIMLRRWIGLDGRIKTLGPFRMTGSSFPGDVVSVQGHVLEKTESSVKIEIIARNDRGEAGRGEAQVTLLA
jgi:3-methylfumaryl-CoA hydratase